MDGDAIIQAVKSKYLNLRSYSDCGTVKVVPAIGKQALEFKTYFERPNKVRFEWLDWHPYFGKEKPPNENAFWSDGKATYTCFFNQQSRADSISIAIAGAAGVSNGSSYMILKLLYPDCVSLSAIWYEMSDAQLLGEEIVHETRCYHIIGSASEPEDTEAWVSKDQFLVRRLRKHTEQTENQRKAVMAEAMKTLEKLGRSTPELPQTIVGPRKYYQDYDYLGVETNIELSNGLFSSLKA